MNHGPQSLPRFWEPSWEPKARHRPKAAAPSSGKSATPSTPASERTRNARQPRQSRTREGNRGTTLNSSAASSHPERQLFGQATPGPAASLRPPARPSTKTPQMPAARMVIALKGDSGRLNDRDPGCVPAPAGKAVIER